MKQILSLLLALLLPVATGAAPLRVFVSVAPQKTFVEKVGGDHVAVRVMVPPGHSPATYDPTPQQIGALAGTRLYVSTGVPFEDAWMGRIRAVNPDMRVLDARDGLDLRRTEPHRHGDGHGNGREQDPHVWTSPPLVRRMAAGIRDALGDLDPANAADYARNYAAFAAELEVLDRDIRASLAELPDRRFLVFHPAWGYFADTYDLVQVPIEHEGKTPGAHSLTALIDQARREGMRVVFVQPQFDRRTAARIAQAIGGQVVAIDPLAADYAANLRRVARQIAGALRP